MTTDFDASAATWDDDPAKVERAQRTAAAILERVPLPPGATAFEFGCGTGLLGFALQPHVARIVLADSSPGMLAVVERKIAATGATNVEPRRLDPGADPLAGGAQALAGGAQDLAGGAQDLTGGAQPRPHECFDLVVSLMALHHVPDTAGLLRRLLDLLAPGGRVALADLDAEDGSFHGPGVDVHHGFDRAALGAQLVEAGFRDVAFTTVFEVERGGRRYPVFLVVATAPDRAG